MTNFVIITTHDTGRHFGCYGIPTVHTPNIDSLANEGVRFSNMFATSPVCSASRAAALTGRYPQSNGLMQLVHSPWDWELNNPEEHLSHHMRNAGYETVVCGIQHETMDVSTLGFQKVLAQREGDSRPNALQIAEAGAAYIRNNTSDPFYLQMGFFETHRPYEFGGNQPDDSLGVTIPPYIVDNETAREDFAWLQGMVRRVDEAVGIVLTALAESGKAEDTVVIFTVDHGLEVPRAKWFCYEAGVEIALVMRHPAGGISGGKVCDWLLGNVDIAPTVLELAGIDIPGNVQGISFAGAFRPEGKPQRTAAYSMFHSNGREERSVRTNKYRLIRSFKPGRPLVTPVDMAHPVDVWMKRPVAELYDMEHDPLQYHSLHADPAYSEVLAEMNQLVWSWMEDVNDPLLQGPVAPPYHEEAMADYPGKR